MLGFEGKSQTSLPSTLPPASPPSCHDERAPGNAPASASDAGPSRQSKRGSIIKYLIKLVRPASNVAKPARCVTTVSAASVGSERNNDSNSVSCIAEEPCRLDGEGGADSVVRRAEEDAGLPSPVLGTQREEQHHQQQQQQKLQHPQQKVVQQPQQKVPQQPLQSGPGREENEVLATSLLPLAITTHSLFHSSPTSSTGFSLAPPDDAAGDTSACNSPWPCSFGTPLSIVTEKGSPSGSGVIHSQFSPLTSCWPVASPAQASPGLFGFCGTFSNLGFQRRSSNIVSQSDLAPQLLANLCEPTPPAAQVASLTDAATGDHLALRNAEVLDDAPAQQKKRLPLRLRLDPSKRPPPLSSLALNLGPSTIQRRRSSSSSSMFRRLSAIFNPTCASTSSSPSPFHTYESSTLSVVAPAGAASMVGASKNSAAQQQSDDAPFCIRNLQLLGPKGAEQYLSSKFERIQQNEQSRKTSSSPTEAKKSAVSPFSTAVGSQNGVLNRYNDVLPYEGSRVKLASDKSYINSSHLVAVDPRLRYITTQGPLQSTVGAFWQMVLEQGSRVIVMLTKLEEGNRIKCHRYWPKPDSPLILPEQRLAVSLTSERTYAEFESIVRTFVVSSDSPSRSSRQITHIQFNGWPDHGVPTCQSSLLHVIRLANSALKGYILRHGESGLSADQYPGPMVVHCSAGVGRSGTFCVVDAALGMLGVPDYGVQPRPLTEAEAAELVIQQKPFPPSDESPYDHVYELVEQFRLQRPLIVQTPSQFIYCYAAVKRGWLSGGRRSSVTAGTEK